MSNSRQAESLHDFRYAQTLSRPVKSLGGNASRMTKRIDQEPM